MGVYDSILTKCPGCGAPLQFQSKSGDCMLRRYSLRSAPPEVVIGTYEEICPKCNRHWKLVLPQVSAIVVEALPEDDEDDEEDTFDSEL
jgi:hypothetical protein